MIDVQPLKDRVCEAIDSRKDDIVGLGESIMDDPELGFKEVHTADRVKDVLTELGLQFQDGLALTGVKAVMRGVNPGPTIALMGELDALVVPEHSRANPLTGAAHACGHNAQIAGLMGAARGLVESGVAADLSGNIVFFAVPAEEYVEIDYRLNLVKEGKTTFLAGKPELLQLGHFDDVDMAIMIHTSNANRSTEGAIGVAASSNCFLAKKIRFVGQAAHSGVSPEKGINALNAATLALSAVNAQRETFRDQDCVRVHPIITKGGDLVNIVPSEVTIETYVRARTQRAMVEAASKVDRAMRGAALAMGCRVEIETVPGYMPLRNDATLTELFRVNAEKIFGAGTFQEYAHTGGSTDAGDLSQIMPVLHPAMTGAAGTVHSPDWHIADADAGYLAPAKTLAMMAVDLLSNDAAMARRIIEEDKPPMSRQSYLARQKEIFATEVYAADA
jgi:amidohydrolase